MDIFFSAAGSFKIICLEYQIIIHFIMIHVASSVCANKIDLSDVQNMEALTTAGAIQSFFSQGPGHPVTKMLTIFGEQLKKSLPIASK